MQRARDIVATGCGWLSAVFLAAMMLLTVSDVLLRAVASYPIRGSFELVELLLACTFFFALPAAFLRREHIVVDMVDAIWPAAVPVLERASALLAVVIMSVMAWQGAILANDMLTFGDVTSDLSLPKIIYWIPVLAGIAGSALAALAMLFAARARSADRD